MSLLDIIRIPFGYVLEYLNLFCNNYGLALILFSLVVKLILLPASAKSKKSIMKTSRLQPLVKQIEIACGGDKQKYQAEVQKLYKEEGVSMFGGCLWSLLPLLFLIPLFTVIREPLTYLLHLDAEKVEAVKKVVAAAQNVEIDKLSYYWQYTAASNIELYGQGIVEGVKSLNFSFLGIDLGQTPTWQVWTLSGWSQIGGALVPILSGAVNYVSMWLSTKLNSSVITDGNGQIDEAAVANSQKNNKMMLVMMPVLSIIFGYMYPLGLSIYWLGQGVFGMIQDAVLTVHYRKIYDAEDKERQERAAKRAAEEAEKERIRAARRAANPDGIVENTSKKKQQLREKQERDAAAKEYEARRSPASDAATGNAGGEENRPYARGRAYDPSRYENNEE